MKVLCFGSVNIDHTYRVTHFTAPGETQTCQDYRIGRGGKGFNQALAVRQAGVETYFAGMIGEDGLFVKEFLSGRNVDTELLRIAPVPTGHAVIEVDIHGQNRIMLFPGANHRIDTPFIDEVLSHFSAGDIVVLQNEISGLPYIMEESRKKGMTVIFNAAPCGAEVASYPIGMADWLVVNEVEGAYLSGETAYDAIPEALRAKYPGVSVLLTLGGEGCRAVTDTEDISLPAKKVTVVDTTGAGDTFIGYFVKGLVEGMTLRERLSLATAASAVAVTRPGGGDSVPTYEEVLDSGLLSL